jgi:uncharacterized protein (TIGR01440 family)
MSMLEAIQKDLRSALEELFTKAKVEEGGILVTGCSTSEVVGKRIGTAGSGEAADVIYRTVAAFCREKNIFLAAQCCEHLNRALVVEKRVMKERALVRVNAVPHKDAGGAFATASYYGMEDPVLVETISADFGIDIGNTLIGMHIRPVVVPVRTAVTKIGEAPLVLARSRCKYVGGERATYDRELG